MFNDSTMRLEKIDCINYSTYKRQQSGSLLKINNLMNVYIVEINAIAFIY